MDVVLPLPAQAGRGGGQGRETCLSLPVADTLFVLIEQTQREPRVRFQHPIRVVTLEGQPRVIRTLTSNVSRDGLFLRMPEPLPPGMKVALSLEAGGRALALAQAEVRWNGPDATEVTERFPGCGVRFTEFMHPRAEELVQYLVKNLDTGKPLALAPPEKQWTKYLPFAGGGALLLCAAMAAVIFWQPGEVEAEEVPAVQLIAESPKILPLPSGEGRGEGEPKAEPVAQPTEVEATEVKPPEPIEESPPQPAIVKVAAAPMELKVPAPRPASAPDTPEQQGDVKLPAGGASKKPERQGEVKLSDGTAPKKPEREGDVKLPAGGAPQLHWELTGTELRIAPQLPEGVQLARAFVLTAPPRAVFDLTGGAEARSVTAPAAPPYATAVRLGKQPAGTRIVVDLDTAPKKTKQDDHALVLAF